jgi:ATP-dependent protease HslVU (ClpYQ) peptidase subunit
MTCIVGLEHQGSAYLGSDSFVGNSNFADSCSGPKLHYVGMILFGHAGSVRRSDVLMDRMRISSGPKRPSERWVSKHIIPEMVRVLKEHDVAFRETNAPPDDNGGSIVAICGHVYEIGCNMGVTRSRYGYAAIGSGYMAALGSLASTLGKLPHVRIRLALEAAERHTPTVRRPWKIMSTKGTK